MLARIRFSCPTCGKKLRAPENKAGVEVSCPGCKGQLQIPYTNANDDGVTEEDDGVIEKLAEAHSRPVTKAGVDKFCRNCGKTVDARAVACMSCGRAPSNGNKYCHNCSAATDSAAIVCVKCGVSTRGVVAESSGGEASKSKITAGLLAFFLGGLGIHKFYLGLTIPGLVFLLTNTVGLFFTVWLFLIPNVVLGVIAFVEAIIYLTKSDEEFERLYVIQKKQWF